MTTCRTLSSRPNATALYLAAVLSLAGCGGGGTDAAPDTTAAETAPGSASGASVQAVADASASPAQIDSHALAARPLTASTLIVRARGSLLNGSGPTMLVLVNGRLVASTEVRATAYQNYTFTLPLLSHGGKLDVVYTNDQAVGNIDRNLWLQSITVDGTTIASTAAVYDQGSGRAAFDGVNTLPGQEGMFWNGALRFNIADPAYAFAGTGVFVDQALGSDSNPGTQALPWKTLAKVASSARLLPGQGIYLRCGQVWRESLALNATQLVDGATLSGYGVACATAKAVISGANDFSTGWTKTGNIWWRSVPAGTPKINRLFVNGVAQMTARWPNKPAAGEGYALVASDAVPSSTAIKVAAGDLASLSGRDLINAVVNVRDMAWKIDTVNVTSYDSANGVLKLAAAASYSIDAGEGYVLQDKLWMLDAAGEFYHDAVNNKLYLYPSDAAAQASLNLQLVEGSVRDVPLALSKRNGLIVRAISARMGRGTGITLSDVPGALVDNVESIHNGASGISLAQDATLAAPTVQNSSFADNWSYGIDAQYAGAASITSNVVTDTGNIANPGWSAAGIQGGDGARIQYNAVDGTGYHGIRFSGTGGSVVNGNTITRHCLRLSDCGAIYTWNGNKRQGSTQYASVTNNQVLGGTANVEGAAGSGMTVLTGIFLDDFSYGVTVRGNMVYGVPYGLSIHNGANNTLDSNRVWAPALSGIVAGMDQNDRDWLTGNVVSNNQVVPISTAVDQFPQPPAFTTPQPIRFFDNLSGGQSLQTGINVFSGNQVVRLNSTMDDVHTWIRSNTTDTKLSSRQWSAFDPADAPTRQPLTFALYSLVLGPELVPGGSFDNGIGSWTSYFNPAGTGGSVTSDAGKSGCSGSCITLSAGTNTDYAASPGFTMRAGAQYLYTFTATLGANATIRYPYISQVSSPWASMAASGYTSSVSLSGVAGQVINYQAFFTAASADLARVNLQLATVQAPVSFDNVSVREIQGYSFSATSDWAAVAYAPAGAAVTVSCGSLGWGSSCTVAAPDGTPITLPQTLAGGSSQLYLRTDSAWRR